MFFLWLKFNNTAKRQKSQPKRQQQQAIRQASTPKSISLHKSKAFSKLFNFTTGFQPWLPAQLVQTVCNKSTLLVYKIFKFRIGTLSSVFLSVISMVKANANYSNQLAPIMSSTLANDLVVCLPKDNNSNSCIKYVNSSLNGLIELNESVYPALKSFHGSYDYKMIARINPFWLKFEPPSDTSYYVMGSLYLIMFVFGVTGNGLVIFMFARCKALRTASNLLVFNLSLSDLMITIKCPVAAYNNFMRGPALGDWGCRLYGFMGGFSGSATIGLLTVISMDRYSVVVNPFNPLRANNKSVYYYSLLLLAWCEAFFFSVIPLLEVGLSVYVPEGYLTTCSFDYLDKQMPARIFMFVFFVFAWCLPLLSIFFCYFHILKAVLFSKNIQSNHNKHKTEVRLAFIVLLVIGLWFLAWTPYAIVAMTGVFGMEKYLTPTHSMIPALFCKTAACLNPFLYTISHKRFRNELQRLFCKRQPIYQYSITRSSYITRSSRRICNVAQNSVYPFQTDTHAKSIKNKISTDNATIGGLVNSRLYGIGDSAKRGFHNEKGTFSRGISANDADIYILQLDDIGALKTQRLETSF